MSRLHRQRIRQRRAKLPPHDAALEPRLSPTAIVAPVDGPPDEPTPVVPPPEPGDPPILEPTSPVGPDLPAGKEGGR